MTTLQEAVKKFIEATKLDRIEFEDWPRDSQTAFESLRTALAQQGEQQPVAWYEYNQDLDAWFLAYGHNPKAKTRPLVFGDTAAPAPQPSQGAVTRRKIFVCAHCDGIYADQTVTQCDCMEGTGADFVEGFAEYPAALQSAQPVARPLTLEQLLDIVKKLGEPT